MATITFDGIKVEVEDGTTILNAARKIGGDIVPPAMCYYTSLKGSGSKCRACLVKVTAGSEKDPRPMPKLVASCITPVQDGMVVENTLSQEVLDTRKSIVEFLLLNHPLDCPICDQAGECDLQNFAFEHGTGNQRYEESRRTFDKIDIGPYVQLHMTRCILCYRCVYVADQITNKRIHGVMSRGETSEISTYIQASIENDFSGNIVDVCPVGALTDKTFRFKSRVWFTKPVNAHRDCDKCCGEVTLWYKGPDVLRTTARKNAYNEVPEGKFICNTCRFERKATSDWQIEGATVVDHKSVINANQYLNDTVKPAFGVVQAIENYRPIEDLPVQAQTLMPQWQIPVNATKK